MIQQDNPRNKIDPSPLQQQPFPSNILFRKKLKFNFFILLSGI
jgi:hypothetical protein